MCLPFGKLCTFYDEDMYGIYTMDAYKKGLCQVVYEVNAVLSNEIAKSYRGKQ